MNKIKAEPLSADVFAPFGDVIECWGEPDKIINQGLCGRYHDRAVMDFSDGQAGLSLFNAKPRRFPYTLEMMERHPDGSQAFIPMTQAPFLVIVALDDDGKPDTPRAFVTIPGQAVNYHRNVWHGVCVPLQNSGLFTVVDRIGPGDNLQEHWFDGPFIIAP